MTIHRALTELKIIGSRIDTALLELKAIGIQVKDSKVNGLYTTEEFPKLAQSTFQSAQDLMSRRGRIKAAIVASNAVTYVTIAEKLYFVADAITQKAFLPEKRRLIEILKNQLKQATAKMNLA